MKIKKSILFIAVIILLTNSVSASWGDGSWNFKSNNPIPNAIRPYQYSLNISNATGTNNATHVFCNGNCNINFTDIRFILDNTIELPYWIENVTTGKVWVNVTANGTVNMYYGNPSATTTSNSTNTFIREIDSGQPVVGAWTLDGNALDTSGLNNNGTLYGGMGYTTGKFGQAGQFDGVNDYVNASSNNFPTGNNSISGFAWIYISSYLNPIGVSQEVFSYGAGTNVFDLFVYTNGQLYLTHWGVIGDPLPLNQWNFVGITYQKNSTNATVYINSNNYTITGTALDIASGGSVRIGVRNDGGYYFKGSIDEVRIYNRALTQAEITDLYNNYGYTTTNYPGRELVRKYASPEPTWATWGAEIEVPPFISIVNNSYSGTTLPSGIFLDSGESITLTATSTNNFNTWNWYKDGVLQANNYNNFTTSFSSGSYHYIIVNTTTLNETSNTIYWGINVFPAMAVSPGNNINLLNESPSQDLAVAIENNDMPGIVNSPIKVYTNLIGLSFYTFIWFTVFGMLWIKQKSIDIPAVIGVIFGGIIVTFLPAQYQLVSQVLIVFGIFAVIYIFFKGRG